METYETISINALRYLRNLKSCLTFIQTPSSERIPNMEKLCVLFVGFLCFSLGQSTTAGVQTTTSPTPPTDIWTSSESQQPVITGLRIKVKSLVDLTSNSPEMELLVRQIDNLIPPQYKATTSITVRNIQKGSRSS